jgi:oligopeptide transport system ATP-binding protein
MPGNNDKPILQVEDLHVQFSTRDGLLRAVRGVSFNLYPGEALGLVGESACGKSVTALSILRLIQCPPGNIEAKKVVFDETDITQATEKQMRNIRGKRISMIFQDPMTSLNPVLSVGKQMSEIIQLHMDLKGDEVKNRCIDLLKMVGLSAPEMRLKSYPHQLSGGMRQRVMIAMAISCNPDILLADEPTTALDVTIQDQILRLVRSLAQRLNMATILITHNFGAVSGNTDRIIVMYAGKIVEAAETMELFHNPLHPYTRGLLQSIPKVEEEEYDRLFSIKGMVPSPIRVFPGCSYAPRCESAMDECTNDTPSLIEKREEHYVSCWKVQ